ncbi:MAG: hypothetical protein C4523_07365, partial [Myxococcales bacterium]
MRGSTKIGGLFAAMALTCLFAGCGAGAFMQYTAKPDFPKNEDGALDLPGLSAPAAVYYDPLGAPHIAAENELDLVRAVGFVQARDRYFGMDMMRRLARGRLSELIGKRPVLGSTSIDFDLAMRGWGIDQASEADAAALGDEERALMAAYTEGVNQALALYRPIEYRLLSVQPEPWTIADCFAVSRLSAWAITHNYHQEAARLLLAFSVGLERAEKIWGHEDWKGGTTLDASGCEPRPLPPAVADELRALFPS